MKERVAEAKRSLRSEGFAVIPDVELRDAERVLSEFGALLPQYDGALSYEVRSEDGIGGIRYSKGTDPIGPHTEAPVYDVPPPYVALYGHRPAACGGGRTSVADGIEILEALSERAREIAQRKAIEYRVTRVQGGQDDLSEGEDAEIVKRFPFLCSDAAGPVLRFSHNLLFFGDCNPTGGEWREPEDPELAELASEVVSLYEERCRPILLPPKFLLIWDNKRCLHAREGFSDLNRHLTRYWVA